MDALPEIEPRLGETRKSMPPVTPTAATLTGSALSSVLLPVYHWDAWRAVRTSETRSLYVPAPRPSVRQTPVTSVGTVMMR